MQVNKLQSLQSATSPGWKVCGCKNLEQVGTAQYTLDLKPSQLIELEAEDIINSLPRYFVFELLLLVLAYEVAWNYVFVVIDIRWRASLPATSRRVQ